MSGWASSRSTAGRNALLPHVYTKLLDQQADAFVHKKWANSERSAGRARTAGQLAYLAWLDSNLSPCWLHDDVTEPAVT